MHQQAVKELQEQTSQSDPLVGGLVPVTISSLPAQMDQSQHQRVRRRFIAYLLEIFPDTTDERLRQIFSAIPDHLRTDAMRLCCRGWHPETLAQRWPACQDRLEQHVRQITLLRMSSEGS